MEREHVDTALLRQLREFCKVYPSPDATHLHGRVLLAIDLQEDFIDVECITMTSVLSFQSACINTDLLVRLYEYIHYAPGNG